MDLNALKKMSKSVKNVIDFVDEYQETILRCRTSLSKLPYFYCFQRRHFPYFVERN
ncbi:MAG: hypothetical protein LE178_03220 [Endomicrobium sp.]|nr:hypothetical protein [Endomicrobium sp.]